MASAEFAPDLFSRRPICLAEIDTAVSARLGPTRGVGNSQPACFNRQVAMYLARHVGRWTTAIIGRFYDSRDHSTVSYGIQRIEMLRGNDPEVDALITDLKRQLTSKDDTASAGVASEERCPSVSLSRSSLEELADLIAARVCAYIESRTRTARQEWNARDA
jgi:hypothetical protein